jgi:hypothetical protein
MIQVLFLVQALHGSGMLALVFIDGDSQSSRASLDQLSAMGTPRE